MKKKIIISAVIVAVLLGIFSMIPRKVSFQAIVPVCTQDGITSMAECDVVLWKWWYMPDKLRGTIVLDDVIYKHVDYETYGDSNPYWFADADKTPSELLSNSLSVYVYGKNFDALSFAYSKDGETKWYFGPAGSVEEVENIIGTYLK